MEMRKLFFVQDDIGASDEYAEVPEHLHVYFDQDLILAAEKVLEDNPWISYVSITERVDYELPEDFDISPSLGELRVSCFGADFNFLDNWSGYKYSVDIPTRAQT